MDHDDDTVFDRTVAWAIEQGIETATFHILTPYPDTALYQRMHLVGRLTTHNWDLYDTRHVVYRPALLSPETLEQGYRPTLLGCRDPLRGQDVRSLVGEPS